MASENRNTKIDVEMQPNVSNGWHRVHTIGRYNINLVKVYMYIQKIPLWIFHYMLCTNICTTLTHTHTQYAYICIYIYMGIGHERFRCTHILLYSTLTYMHIFVYLYVTRKRWKVKTENRFLEEMTSTNILLSYYLYIAVVYCCNARLVRCLRVAVLRARPTSTSVCARSTVVVAKNNRVTPKEYRVFRPISSFR